MIRVTIKDNVRRLETTIDENTTVGAVLDANEVDYSRGLIQISGSTLAAGEINKTFADLGFDGTPGHERPYVMVTEKLDNAR